ncbi:MAG: methyl-accepting chemotaxis protein [Rhodocyclaceae bacterium]|nr:MAG: methyl-accepting chemotaxis protein [Rhodocyclaceae bacterium]
MKVEILAAPAVALMDRFRYVGKFLLMGGVAAVALGYLLVQFMVDAGQGIARINDELAGMRHLLAVRQVYESMQQHRTLSIADVTNYGGQSKDVLKAAQDKVESAMAAVSAMHADSHLSTLQADWEVVTGKDGWGESKTSIAQMGNVGFSVERLTSDIKRVELYMQRVSATTALQLDPELATSLMIELTLNQLQYLGEILAQERDVAYGGIALKDFTANDVARLKTLISSSEAGMERLMIRLNMLIPLMDSAKGDVLKQQVDVLKAAIDKANKAYQQIFWGSVDEKSFMPDASAPVDAVNAMIKQVHGDAVASLEHRRSKRLTALFLTGGGALVAVLGFAYLCIGAYLSLSRGVNSVVQSGNRLAAGDLTALVEVKSKDEIADIAKAFNTMASEMQRVISTIQDGAGKVSKVADGLANSTQQVGASSRKQSEAASTVAAAMEQMTVSIQSVADNAADVDNLAGSSLSRTREGSEALKRMVSAIDQVRSAVTEISTSVTELVESTRSIHAMTSEVKDIADQTNLLALNAAIEAARAGEQGRGFAVVADEVRKLAEKSGAAANQIDEVTGLLGTRTSSVEGVVAQGNQALKVCQDYLVQVESILAEAQESVTKTTDGMSQITLSVREQTSTSTHVARNVEDIARLVEDNCHSMDQAVAQSGQLRSMAAELDALVSRFHV